MKKILIAFILLLFAYSAEAQFSRSSGTEKFYFDAVCFRDSDSDSGRVDVFILVPYQSLTFINKNDVYGAQYSLFIMLKDSLGRTVKSEKLEKKIKEKDYYVSQGGTGAFEKEQVIFTAKPGNYIVEVEFTETITNESYERSRTISVLDFDAFEFSTSGLMLVSSIEEREGNYVITPHISDNIGMIDGGFFIFFESYNYSELDYIKFKYEILDKDKEVVFTSDPIEKELEKSADQHFIKIKMPSEAGQGVYLLRLYSLTEENSKDRIIASSERSIKYYKTISGFVLDDINLAIRQLRYAADGDELDYIQAGETEDEKQKRFEEFWDKKDPTPKTERNEAFEQYYMRINIANKEFKSYNEGWLTDKGMVFIIFGTPDNIERSRPYSGNREYERWTYNRNNRQFIFVDNTGFGDFRLAQPIGITQKYEYQE